MTTDEMTHPHDVDQEVELDAEDEAMDAIGGFAGRLFEASLGAIEMLTIYIGLRTGAYAALAAKGPLTVDELADQASVNSRYAREWLEQQTVAGIVECADRTVDPDLRRFALPTAHATVLLESDHPACTAPLALACAGVGAVMQDLVTAYRTGGGVPYSRYGTDFRDGQAGFNRPSFVNLAASWIAEGLPVIDARLRTGREPRIADIGCGAGWSSISLAIAYRNVRIDGFDLDDASVADARQNANEAGVSDRIRFEVRDAVSEPTDGERGAYDLVTIFEALHDMAHPVDALKACLAMLRADGIVVVMDERVADTFAESDGPFERFLYGASSLHCLPVGMSESGSAGTGALMRPDTLHRYAAEAGFVRVDVLAIEHDMYRFYALVPSVSRSG